MLNNAEIAALYSQISSSTNLESFGFMPCKRIYTCTKTKRILYSFYVKKVGFLKILMQYTQNRLINILKCHNIAFHA